MWPFRSAGFTVLASAGVILVAAAYLPSRAADPPGLVEGRLESVGPGASTIQVALPPPLGSRVLTVDDPGFKLKLGQAQARDLVKIDVDDTGDPHHMKTLAEISRPVTALSRIMSLALAFFVLLMAAALATNWRPLDFIIGADNRYSNSKCQLVLWFGAFATVYLSTLALRIVVLGWDFIGGVGITQNLLVLTGLSAFTYGGAKVITTQKVNAAARAGLPPVKQRAAAPNLLSDLVQDDRNNADIGDFQMIFVTVLAVIIFGLSSFHFLSALALERQISLPDVDTALLSGFGIGQGAYLVKKAAANAGEG